MPRWTTQPKRYRYKPGKRERQERREQKAAAKVASGKAHGPSKDPPLALYSRSAAGDSMTADTSEAVVDTAQWPMVDEMAEGAEEESYETVVLEEEGEDQMATPEAAEKLGPTASTGASTGGAGCAPACTDILSLAAAHGITTAVIEGKEV